MEQKQLERVLEDYINIPEIAKELMTAGFAVASKNRMVTAEVSGRKLMLNPKRMYVLSDGWIRDEYLSYHWNRVFDWAPENLEKKIPLQLAQEYTAGLSDKTYIVRQPSRFELLSVVDLKNYNPAIIEAAKIMNLKTYDGYCTEECMPPANVPSGAYCVSFNCGSVYYGYKSSAYYVRPVRSTRDEFLNFK